MHGSQRQHYKTTYYADNITIWVMYLRVWRGMDLVQHINTCCTYSHTIQWTNTEASTMPHMAYNYVIFARFIACWCNLSRILMWIFIAINISEFSYINPNSGCR